MNHDVLAKYGVDYKKGIERCLGDVEFYEKLLGLFLDDDVIERAEAAFAAKDMDTLFECMHELKGSCGNLDIKELYDAVSPFVELLRMRNCSNEQLVRMFGEVRAAYYKAKYGIKLAL